MTLGRLIKNLQIIERKHGGRKKVTFACEEISNHRNPDHTHSDVTEVGVESILWSVEDSTLRKDGSERWKTVVVLG